MAGAYIVVGEEQIQMHGWWYLFVSEMKEGISFLFFDNEVLNDQGSLEFIKWLADRLLGVDCWLSKGGL